MFRVQSSWATARSGFGLVTRMLIFRIPAGQALVILRVVANLWHCSAPVLCAVLLWATERLDLKPALFAESVHRQLCQVRMIDAACCCWGCLHVHVHSVGVLRQAQLACPGYISAMNLLLTTTVCLHYCWCVHLPVAR
jgi:hypothetical protein